ncbi:hypothetical protein [Caballeronia grimmiae]|uniref:hypothetical protein n=1 Tax=Caballeronia grimmiae TaxID=1071679 RepID=UPI0038BBE5FD
MTVADGYALGRMWAEQRRADDNARIANENLANAKEWQAYAKQLEAKLTEVRRELKLLRREQTIAKRERAVIVEQAKQHQLRAAVLDTLQNRLAAELEKASPGHALVSAERREMIIDGSIKAVQQPTMRL